MLGIVSLPNTKLPIKISNKIDRDFQPGMVLFSQNGNPVGIIDDIRDGNVDTTIGSGLITVWNCRFIGITDQYFDCRELNGSDLYSTDNFKLTTNSELGRKIPAIIIDSDVLSGAIKFLWLGVDVEIDSKNRIVNI